MGDTNDMAVEPSALEDRSSPDASHQLHATGRGRLLSPRPRKRKRRRHFSDWHESRSRKPLSTLLLGVLLVGAPQLLGGVLPWTINVIAVLSFACLAVVALRAPALERRWPRFALMMLVMAAWTGLQALPLPCGLVAALAPDSVAKQRAVAALMDLPAPSTCALSQEPGNTHEELVKVLSLTATFIAAWAFAASGGWRRLFFLIGFSSFAISAVALAHAALELKRVFGVYHPVGLAGSWLLSPVMNPNNMGAFAAMGAPLWIGLSYREPNQNLRVFGYVATAVTSVVAMGSLSRGAIGQLLAGYAVMAVVLWRRRARAQRDSGRPTPPAASRIGVFVAGGVGLSIGVFMVGNDAVQQFQTGRLDKLDLSLASLRFAWQHALVGVGRGAFGSAFISAEGAVTRYQYAENFVAHWLAEWGVPMTLCLLAAIGFELATAAKSRDSLARSGAISALWLYAAQNLVDFSFELLGTATVAVALLAGCIAPLIESSKRGAEKPLPLQGPTQLAITLLCIGIGCLVWLGPRMGRERVNALAGELRRSLASSDRPKFRAQALQALTLHPSEPVLSMLVASEALAHRDPKTLAWLNRSMQLAPHWARPHQLAFRWLWQRGQGRQALLELKQAASIDLEIAMEDACRLGRVDPSWALQVAPENELRHSYLERVSFFVGGSPRSREMDLAVLQELPTSLFPLMHEAQRLQGEDQTDEALALLDRAAAAHRNDPRPGIERFRVLLAANRLRELFDGIDAALETLDPKSRAVLLEVKAYALARAGSAAHALRSVEDIRRLAGTDPTLLAQSYGLEGQVHLALKQPGAALASYREAYRINEDTNWLIQVANIAESQGDRAQALWAYVHLCEREPRGGGCERRNALLSPPTDNSGR
jgi:tetratricopeptide (TPR) repeat protein